MGNKPFLKWAGGKRWLVDRTNFRLPAYNGRYIEPFLGGGAVFFAECPKVALLGDKNAGLIETYISIRDNVDEVVSLLEMHHGLHCKDYYYSERGREYHSPTARAAQFIYLNRACWNGLYRVNLKGKFNVPIGSKSWILSPTDNFKSISMALQATELIAGDFAPLIQRATEGDLIFADPPYTVAHNYNGFVKYNEHIFSWSDQQRLAEELLSAKERGAHIVMTNADHPSVRDLYCALGTPYTIERQSVISGVNKGRSETTELLYVR